MTWTEQVNAALERAQAVDRVDHRSFARQARMEEMAKRVEARMRASRARDRGYDRER